ncbi:TPA: hypothetical protein ACH3X1_007336 [Trebouxia sp. C0004]
MARSTCTGAPLTSFDLEAVFRHYFGDTIRHEEWIEPGQLQMQAKHAVVQKLLTALKKPAPPHLTNQLPEQGLQPLTPVQPPAQMHGGQGRQSYDQQQAYQSPHQQQAYQQAWYQQAPPGQCQARVMDVASADECFASFAKQDRGIEVIDVCLQAQDAQGIEQSSGSSDSASSSKKTLQGMWKQIVH